MKIISLIYARIMSWACHPRAYWYLGCLSFAEASFIPIPTEIILVPMSLAHPQQLWKLATVSIASSMLGGLVNYTAGWLALDSITPLLHYTGYWTSYVRAEEWYAAWGVGAIFLAAISLIPYRLFAIIAGAINDSLLAFFIASLLGRSIRFLLVILVITLSQQYLENNLDKYLGHIE